ncbi:MAG: putative ABC transporter permease, partial [Bacilli bacterium]
YAVSWIMEILFNQRWWDYSSDILNINGRVSVRNSLLLTTGAMVFLYGVQPILNKILSKIKSNILNILAFIIIIVMSVDLILTILKYI